MNGMTLKVDKAGRIVLPKRVRDRFHLHPGSDLTLEEGPDALLLRPVQRRASLVDRKGILVHLGQAPPRFDWSRLVEDERDDRLRDVAGL